MRVDVSAFVGISGTRMGARADRIRRAFDSFGFGAEVFETDGAVLAATDTVVSERGFVVVTKRSTIIIEVSMSGFGVSWVERNTHTPEAEVIFEHGVSVVGIERSVSEESFESEVRVRLKEIGKDWFEGR
jgi:hypothetical protein